MQLEQRGEQILVKHGITDAEQKSVAEVIVHAGADEASRVMERLAEQWMALGYARS